MFKTIKHIGIILTIASLFILAGCEKEKKPDQSEIQFNENIQKLQNQANAIDNSVNNVGTSVMKMKSDIIMSADEINTELSTIKKTQIELKETLNNIIKEKAAAAAKENGKKSNLFIIIIYAILIIFIIWIIFRFKKGKGEEDEEMSEYTTFTYEGEQGSAESEKKTDDEEKK